MRRLFVPERLPQVLICDDDSAFQLAIKHSLKGMYEFRSAYNTDEALAILRNTSVDVLLLDIQMRTPDEGLSSIPKLLELDPELSIIMVSAMTDFRTVREAMRRGAADYVPKDCEPDELQLALQRMIERRKLLLRRQQQNFEAVTEQRRHAMVGEGAHLRDLRRIVEKVRQSRANVVITGETGTGKEVVARQLRGTLQDGSLVPFVAVDSSTIQSTMAESILFGHEKGAFTGADKPAKGIFEEADGGIAYFDEIGNMPLEIQAKLLRVLQEKEVARLGSTKVMKLEFRVVCATNKDLEAMTRAGQFKDDLLQRLNVLPIQLAPLRERREDIPALIEHFAGKQGRRLAFTQDAIETLQSYPWPGNIRELGNVVAYVSTMADGPEVDVADLPPRIRDAAREEKGRSAGGASEAGESAGDFYDRVAAYEKELLGKEYSAQEGNVSRMAMALGMDRSHLYTKLREYGIHAGSQKKGGKS